MYKFKFADIGEGLHEGVVAEIYKKEGEEVKEGDSLFSVETDKVTSDIPSPVTGVVEKVLMNTGDTIHVGDVTYHINDGSEDVEEGKNEEEAASVVGSIEVSNKVIDFSSMSSNSNSKKIEIRQGKRSSILKEQDNVLSTPFARSLASEKGIDITLVRGTGFNGRVLVKDIESFKFGEMQNSVPIQPKREIIPVVGEGIRKKITPIRKAIAKAMTTSWQNVAYTNLVNEVNMTKLWNERKKIVQPILEKTGIKLTFTAFSAKAVALALKEFPQLNSKYDESTDEILECSSINLGLAVDTPKGLMVPVIKDADKKTLVEIAKDIIDLATKARDGKLKGSDMQGGTFTLTNFGSAGAMWGVPVINVGEMGILGTGTIVDRVYADENGEFYNGKVMNLTCAADHRWVDGAEIGRFNLKVKELLENPETLKGDI